jgi:DNA-binding transcriptional LysR family regulator
MNFRDLTYFDALATLKNYTAVAQQFNVSQPTITYAIKRLEDELNTQLLIRDHSHHQIELTANGRQLEQHVTIILH